MVSPCLELVKPEIANRLQHHEPRLAMRAVIGLYHAVVNELAHEIERVVADRRVHGAALSRFQGKPSDEYREPTKQRLLAWREELVAPGDRVAHRAQACRHVPAHTAEHGQSIGEPPGERLRRRIEVRARASAMASGKPSTRRQISATVPPPRRISGEGSRPARAAKTAPHPTTGSASGVGQPGMAAARSRTALSQHPERRPSDARISARAAAGRSSPTRRVGELLEVVEHQQPGETSQKLHHRLSSEVTRVGRKRRSPFAIDGNTSAMRWTRRAAPRDRVAERRRWSSPELGGERVCRRNAGSVRVPGATRIVRASPAVMRLATDPTSDVRKREAPRGAGHASACSRMLLRTQDNTWRRCSDETERPSDRRDQLGVDLARHGQISIPRRAL